MIKYWPKQQSFELNNAVASLFSYTKYKFSYSLLQNKTKDILPIDIIDSYHKSKLFITILQEIEILILDIIELNLNIENINLLNHKILCDLIDRSLTNFFLNKQTKTKITNYKYSSYYINILFFEHRLLLENLLIYLIFGSNYINNTLFAFENTKTPQAHVSILLENLIIQIGNLAIIQLIENLQSLSQTINFLIENRLCHSSYISIRSIVLLRNNLILQNLIYKYINQPKAIYNARYKVWLLSSQGIICKYIYTSRLDDIYKLSKLKRIFLLILEIQDILYPKLAQFLSILGKILLYILIKIVGNTLIFFIRTIVISLNNRNE